VWRFAGWLSRARDPERPSYEFRPKDLRFAFVFGWRLAGWLSRSRPQHLAIPDCSARASSGMQLANWRQQNQNNKIDWVTRLS
jgi:hypothetical protein